MICYCGAAEETEKHNHSLKREKTSVIKSGSSSTQIEETDHVILGEKASKQEEKRVENQGKILPTHDIICVLHICIPL